MKTAWMAASFELALVAALAGAAAGCGGSKASRSWSALQQCLIGEPLAPGENVFFRIREVELAERTPPLPAERWPDRCIEHARQLHTTIEGSGESALLKRLLREQLGCSDEKPDGCEFPKDRQPLIKADETLKAAEIAGLERVAVPDVKPPARRMKPLVGKQLASLAPAKQPFFGARALASGALVTVYLRAEGKPFRICEFSATGESARCSNLAGVSPEFSPEGLTAPGAPLALVGSERSEGVARESDEWGEHEGRDEVAYLLPSGERSRLRSGVLDGFAIEARGGRTYIVEVKRGEVVAQSELARLGPENHPVVFQGWLGWFEALKEKGAAGDPRRVMRWQRLGAGAKLAGDPITLEGDVPERVDLCPSEGGGALHGWIDERYLVWLLSDQGWSKPVEAKVAPGGRAWGPDCRKGRLERAWLGNDSSRELRTLVCSAAGCKVASAKVDEPIARWRGASAMGDRTLALYEAATGDLRLRVAPPAAIMKGDPAIVMDDAEYSGPKLLHDRIVLANDYVLLHFDDEESHHAVVLRADGSAAAVAVE